jgi:hypothetical protein
MAIPGITQTVIPDVYTNIITNSKGASIPGGVRTAAIIGLGTRSEVIITAAQGSGLDGLNPTYTSATGSDGRHFALSLAPIISNRTTLFHNGVPLVGLEAQIDSNPFSNSYGYRIDIATGHIELQRAHLVDQGGSFYTIGATNIGVGTLQNLSLVDINAPSETWTIKCVSVQRNNLNQPIAGTASFVAFGSVSGNVLDANGNPVVWVANNTVATNTILQFSILETQVASVTVSAFREGDFFTLKVASGALGKNDTLTASYIAVSDINTPVFFDNIKDISIKHGPVTLDNTLPLGCFLAFANATPGILCLQAAPSLPRRSSYELLNNFPATSTNCNDFIIPLPLGVSPDPNSQIHIFVTNPTTLIEKQLLPNKFPFFTLGDVGDPTVCNFVFDNAAPPAGNSFSYSVIQENAAINFATDGYLNRDLTTQINGTFSSASIVFDSTYVGKQLDIIDAVNLANIGSFDIVGVSGGDLAIRADSVPPFADFINEASVHFDLVDSVFGNVIAGTSGTDGALVAIPDTATGTFHSVAINFAPFNPVVNGYKLQITASSNGNVGLFDITSYNSGSNTLTIAKSFVSEHNLKFEVIDTSQTSDFLVLNHNIVPNGYNLRVTLVDIKDSTFFDAGWETALAAMETVECDILVPLPKQTISVIFDNCLNHCLTMSNILNKKERVLFIGAINGLTPDNVTGVSLAAVEDIGVLEGIQGATIADILAGNTEDLANYSVPDAFGETFRCAYFYPDQIVVQVGTQNQIIDGFYLAAAAAGYLSGITNVSIPLTRKTLSGFTILTNRQFSPRTLQNLVAAGIIVLQPVQGGGSVVWGLTTTQSGFVEEQELSIVFIRDRIAKTLRQGLRGFIGQAADGDEVTVIGVRATALLNSFVSQKLITAYADLNVQMDPVDPTQINIFVKVQPIYPINKIYVEVSVGLI